MRGHLQQRGADSWRLKVFLGRSADGKKRYMERTIRGTRREAEQELARLVVEAGEGRWVPTAPMTMAELLDRWLRLKEATVEPSTAKSYRWLAKQYVVPVFGDRKVASIRTMELDEFYASLRTSGGEESRPLCRAVRSGSATQSCAGRSTRPASGASSPATRRGTPLPRRRGTPRSTRRRSSRCATCWPPPGELLIRRNIAHVGRDIVEKATKTHQSRRVSIDASTLELLRQHQLRCRELALRVGMRLEDKAFLFSEEPSFETPWRPDVCTNRFGRLRATLGLESVRLHDLRHFTATALGQSGTPVATISARLGHRDKATTLNIYSHTLPATDALAAETISRLIGDPRRQHGS